MRKLALCTPEVKAMGAVNSQMPSNRVGHAPEEPGAPEGEEEAEEVAVAVIEEGEESEEARPTTSQGRHKRKTGPEGQLTKAPHRISALCTRNSTLCIFPSRDDFSGAPFVG